MNSMKWALLAILLLPVLEIYLLIRIGTWLGFLPTILLLGAAAALGTYLLRTQGWKSWSRIQQSLATGRMPAHDLIDGGIVLGAGALLLLPGFLSDAAGLLLLAPASRRFLVRYFLEHALVMFATRKPSDCGPHVIEGEFRREN
ncbi:MAG TPA: FxsA family protein [Methylococcus sp.]|nr:FxsA family protein [Methylococcus sp.]